MNEGDSGGAGKELKYHLHVILHSVLSKIESDFFSLVNQNLPPLIKKKMFSHVLYKATVLISRFYVLYKWNLGRSLDTSKQSDKTLYFDKLIEYLSDAKKFRDDFHKNGLNEMPSFRLNLHPAQSINMNLNNAITNKNAFLRLLSISKKIIGNAKIIMTNKLITVITKMITFSFQLNKNIHLREIIINCQKVIPSENAIKNITAKCSFILNKSNSPLYDCVIYLSQVCNALNHIHIIKEISKYAFKYNFTIEKDNKKYIFFKQLQLKVYISQVKDATSFISQDNNMKFIIPHSKKYEIRQEFYKLIETIAKYKIQKIKYIIDEWIDEFSLNYIMAYKSQFSLYLSVDNHVIFSLSINHRLMITCNNHEFIQIILDQDKGAFCKFMACYGLKIVAEYLGVFFSPIYEKHFFLNFFSNFVKADCDKQLSSAFISSQALFKAAFQNDYNIWIILKNIFSRALIEIIYRRFLKILSKKGLKANRYNDKIIMSFASHIKIIFKIEETGYWKLKFAQPTICKNALNMSLMFQGNKINTRFAGYIYHLMNSVFVIDQMIDQAYHHFTMNRSIFFFHVMLRNTLLIKIIDPFLNNRIHPTSQIFIYLQSTTHVGKNKNFDIFEGEASIPIPVAHCINHPILDLCLYNALQEKKIQNEFGAFLRTFLPAFEYISAIFNDKEWEFLNFRIDGLFQLIYQSKYTLLFEIQSSHFLNITIPIKASYSMVLQIPLLPFPLIHQINENNENSEKNEKNKTQKTIRIPFSKLEELKDSIVSFFSDKKFLSEYGFNKVLLGKDKLVIQKTDPYHPNWIQMKALLRSDGLDFHFLDNNPSHAEDVLRYLLKTQKYHDRKIKNRAIKFCFDCMQINKLTGIGFFNCLHILREDDFIKVDWEQSLSSSTVDISHCLINFHLFINDHSYQIFINSENEEKDSDDAAVSVYSDNHQIFQVKRLNDDLKKWLRDIVSNEATQSLTYDLAFL